MPSRDDVTYFGAGPAGLPSSVVDIAAEAFRNFNGTGVGVAEISHRSADAGDVIKTAIADLRTFLEVPDDYEIIFMQAGGTGEFSATIYNFVAFWVERKRQQILKTLGGADGKGTGEEPAILKELQKAVKEELKVDYIVSGSWSLKASQEAARLLGPEHVNIVTDAREANGGKFGKIPHENTWKLSKSPAMVYFCDNETVDGVEFPEFPKALEKSGDEELIVVADMSSNILSRRIPISKYSLIYFGAQKNLGITGITVVIVKKSLLPPALATPAPALIRQLGLPISPIMFEYATIAKNGSLYNTLSIFDVYVAGQVLKSLLSRFPNKIDGQQGISDKKAALLYAAIDAYPDLYKVVPDKACRSRMNICFNIIGGGPQAEKEFLAGATKENLLALKGHRSVGGIRASSYNSVSLEGAVKLVEYLKKFADSQSAK